MAQINALLIETGVDMGDHGETITKAIEVEPNMTLAEFCDKYLRKYDFIQEDNCPDPNRSIVLRLAVR